MRGLRGKVVGAEKAAQANVIRRREETTAARSLLDTAKAMESKTVALRLKELETLESSSRWATCRPTTASTECSNKLVRLKP